MERGELLASETLPKVAKEMARSARAGGALAQAMQSNRAAMGRMKTQWQLFTDAMFKAGIGDLMTELFDTASNALVALRPLAVFISSTLSNAISTATKPIRVLVDALARLSEMAGVTFPDKFSATGGQIIGTLAGIAGAIFMAKGLSKLIDKLVGKLRHLSGTAAKVSEAARGGFGRGSKGGRRGGSGGLRERIAQNQAMGGGTSKGAKTAAGRMGSLANTISKFGGYLLKFMRFFGWAGLGVWAGTELWGLFGDDIKAMFGSKVDSRVTTAETVRKSAVTSMGNGVAKAPETYVEISVKDGELSNFIEAKVTNNNDRITREILSNTAK